MNYAYGKFAPEHLEKIKEGVELFNEQKYWECHESLEDLWMEDRNDNARYVYWAIIQVAASCIHYRDENLIGAQGMLFKSKEKFKKCRELSVITDLVTKFLDWEELEELVFAVPSQPQLEDFRKIFEFRFKNYQGSL